MAQATKQLNIRIKGRKRVTTEGAYSVEVNGKRVGALVRTKDEAKELSALTAKLLAQFAPSHHRLTVR